MGEHIESQQHGGHRINRAAILFLLNMLLAVGVVVSLPFLESHSLRSVCLFGIAAVGFVWSTIVVSSRQGLFSFSSLYVSVFIAFHFGLSSSFGLGHDIIAARGVPWFYNWFFEDSTPIALILCISAVAAFAAGSCLQSALGRKPSYLDLNIVGVGGKRNRNDLDAWLESTRIISIVGFVLVIVSVLFWSVVVVTQGGLRILLAGYLEFLDAMVPLRLMYAYFGMGLGMALLAVGSRSGWRRWGYGIFAGWALIAFPLGLRGEVLFPIAGALVVTSMRKPPLSTKKFVVVVLLILLSISAVRVMRISGLRAERVDTVDLVNPLDALMELGGSLRPVAETVRWIEDGDKPMMGASYWAPIERLVHYLLPLWNRPPSTEDHRLMNVLVQYRVGTIGFSPVAEAYYNFMKWGPFLVMFIVGNLVGWVDRFHRAITNQLLAAIIVVPLLINIRNAFAQVPGQLILGLVIVLLPIWLAGRIGISSYSNRANRDGA